MENSKKIKNDSEKKVTSIHQPNFIPWPGYYHKICHSDAFVFLDNVEFTKGGFINRNKIKLSNGQASWLTIPVKISKSSHQEICEVALNPGQHWRDKHLKTLQSNYSKAEYFHAYFDAMAEYYEQEYASISDFNIALTKYILKQLNCNADIHIASEMDLDQDLKRNELLIEICRKLDTDIYLSGRGARNYNDEPLFRENGIQLRYQDFTHPTYPQLWGDFISHLSIIDLLFNCGPQSRSVLLGEQHAG